jgi:hypothetical protein
MKSDSEVTRQEQLDDLGWASLVLCGAIGSTYGNVEAAINMVEVIAERGEPEAKEVAQKILNSYQVRVILEKARLVSAITNPLKRQTA